MISEQIETRKKEENQEILLPESWSSIRISLGLFLYIVVLIRDYVTGAILRLIHSH